MTTDSMADSLKDLDFNYSNDPLPTEKKPSRSERRNSRQDPAPKGPGRPSNKTVQNEVRDEIDAFIALMAVPIVMRDPHCGGVVMQQRTQIADALSEIAMHNPAMLKFLRSGGDIMMYFKLVTALSPIAVTVYQHHFTSEEAEEESDNEFGSSFLG